MRIATLILILCSLTVLGLTSAMAQTMNVGSVAEDYSRRLQLTGQVDTSVSFTIRPLINAFYFDSLEAKNDFVSGLSVVDNRKKKLKMVFLPISLQTQFNSHHPYGWNDGGFIPAKGGQLMASAGFYFEYGPLSIQFKPEFLTAENREFETFNKNHYDVIVARYYDIYNNIDLPVRFGTGTYKKAYWGQSSIRLNYKSVSAGISSENLWWGPGMRNSLLLSNTSPGFLHLTFNTRRPVKTPIGSFEWQIIGGRLENSGFAPLTPDRSYFGVNLYDPKPDQWRYLSGMILTWQPKWVPGLFLGFEKAKIMYGKDASGVKDYLPFSSEGSTSAPNQPISQRDQLGSVFIRWLWKKEQAEMYFEWGQYNNRKDFVQNFLQPNASRAYTFGLRKLVSIDKKQDEGILISLETTLLQTNSIENLRAGKEWYTSKAVRQGYTNMGESLGAGIGPGANIQSVEVSWVKKLKRVGLQLERYVHDNDFYFYAFQDGRDFRRHWVDLSLGGTGEWNYKNFLFNVKVSAVKSLNYQWYLKQNIGDPYFVNGLDVFNLYAKTGVTYRF